MTYTDLARIIQRHQGRVFACVNAEGGQFHIEAKKGKAMEYFNAHARAHGKDAESGLGVEVVGSDLYIDTEVSE